MRISDWSSDVCSSDLIGVELDRDIAAEFQMLLLIFAHGNMGRLVEQNVGSLQHGIDEQANAGTLAVLACLVLELRHAIEPTKPRGAIPKPGQFSMGGHTGVQHGRAKVRTPVTKPNIQC